jgi:hypothetical protein
MFDTTNASTTGNAFNGKLHTECAVARWLGIKRKVETFGHGSVTAYS